MKIVPTDMRATLCLMSIGLAVALASTGCGHGQAWTLDPAGGSLGATAIRWGAMLDPLPGDESGRFSGLLGTRKIDGRERAYVLVGSGLFVERFSGVRDAVAAWLRKHPKARVHDVWVPPAEEGKDEWRYVLVADGEDVLNLDLVRHGHIPAGTLECGEKDLAMPLERYRAFLNRARAAEAEAKAGRLGIWGDEFDYGVWIRDREPQLLAYAQSVREGRVEQEQGMITFPAPEIAGKSPIKVIHVTKDDNGNVYFVTSESFVSFNKGFVHKQGPLLGDGGEPRIAQEEHLFGPWWYYMAH